jgi:hypothetical protein
MVHTTIKEHPVEMAAIMPAPSPVVLAGDSVVVELPFSSVVEEDGSCGVLVGPLVLVVGVTVVDFVVVDVVASLVELLVVVVEVTVVSIVVVEPVVVVGTVVGGTVGVVPVGMGEVTSGVVTGGKVGNGGRVSQSGGHCEDTTANNAKRLPCPLDLRFALSGIDMRTPPPGPSSPFRVGGRTYLDVPRNRNLRFPHLATPFSFPLGTVGSFTLESRGTDPVFTQVAFLFFLEPLGLRPKGF